MRLKKIKLAGFKSFVEPTNVLLPGQLVSVVGPNGCGKSNIIDAVRWVMGESSAKTLRGEAMTDVIFNGSSARQPVGKAMIELVFDNQDGTIKGEYAQYNEISIRREVNREAQSTYYLNGTRCRRRDITGIFLGTGLGPRSYSIIEQGTISHLIEAKPDELRVFLEEAAGISKYKERRRETENRMRHTQDNLDRINDIREELEKQIERLKRQSNAAARYKTLKQEERLLKAQLQALRWSALDEHAKTQEQAIKAIEVEIEGLQAEQQGLNTEQEKLRNAQADQTDVYNEIQGRYYGIGADIARLEEALQNAKAQQAQYAEEQATLQQTQQALDAQMQMDSARQEELTQSVAQLTPESEQAKEKAQSTQAALQDAEQAMQDWQAAWETFNQQAAETSEETHVQQTRLQHLEQSLQGLQDRIARFNTEYETIDVSQLNTEIASLTEQAAQWQAKIDAQQVHQVLADIKAQRDANHEHANQLDSARQQLQTLRGRHASLEALQQAALGKQSTHVVEWLTGQQLDSKPRLAQNIQVDAGWDQAAETVLGSYLEAVCVEGFDSVTDALADLNQGQLVLLDTQATHATNRELAAPLADKIKTDLPVDSLLAGVYAVATLPEALALRAQLAPHESVVTQEGIWLGAAWLRVTRDNDNHAGVLQREQELKQLTSDIESNKAQVETVDATLAAGRQNLQALEATHEAEQAGLAELTKHHSELRSQLSAKHARLEQLQQRAEQIKQETAEAAAQMEVDQQAIRKARGLLETAIDAMATQEASRQQRQAERENLHAAFVNAREQAREAKEKAHELTLALQSSEMQLTATREGLARLQAQRQTLLARFEQMRQQPTGLQESIDKSQQELNETLAKRLDVEAELNTARKQLDDYEHQLRTLERKRADLEQNTQASRDRLQAKKMEWQEFHVRRDTIIEQLAETEYALETVLADMPEEAEEKAWDQRASEIAQKIQRLGPINLAAIEEFETESERKAYLDSQHDDLVEALETLQNAIHKIDKETRARFKETYDQVNDHFQQLFPRLFGGGRAYLELTGDNLLDTGVGVMAQPPGKRNSSIHLLSGGEKALTAVALVFSIFQLNPAPFCILDEVDAPLDDANVGRFCSLVTEMSKTVQFIFISHNKLAIEMADHLIGVTMHEAGVSRLVAVDVQEAVAMAG